MTGPFIVISRSRLKPGRAESYAAWCEAITAFVEENEPRLLAFNIYESEDHTSSVVVQIHPDAESMEYHLKLCADKLGEMFDYIDVDGVELYGPTSPALTEWVNHGIEGLPVTKNPVHRAGFTRLQGA
jgi:hypothetical protein